MGEGRMVELAAREYKNAEEAGDGLPGGHKGGSILRVDLKAESRQKMEWGIWKKYCAIERHSRGKKERAPTIPGHN